MVRDILITGTGLFMVVSQVFVRSPSDLIIGGGLALTAPTLASHIKGLLSPGHGESDSSAPSERAGHSE